MTTEDFNKIIIFTDTFNQDKDGFTAHQVQSFLQQTYDVLVHFKRDLTIAAYSKRKSDKYADLSGMLLNRCIDKLRNLDYRDCFSKDNEKIIEYLTGNCISAINGINTSLQKLNNNNERNDFFDPHYNYSFNSNIPLDKFQKVYEKYLNMQCFNADYATYANLRYFVLGDKKPYLVNRVEWFGGADFLNSFLVETECISQNRTANSLTEEKISKIFLLKSQSVLV